MKVLGRRSRNRAMPYLYRNIHHGLLNQTVTLEFQSLMDTVIKDGEYLNRLVDNHINPMMELIENSQAFSRFVTLKFADETFESFPELVNRIAKFSDEFIDIRKSGNELDCGIISLAIINFLNEDLFDCYRTYSKIFVQSRLGMDYLYFDDDFFQVKTISKKSLDLRRRALQKVTVRKMIETFSYPLTFLDALVCSMKRIHRFTSQEHEDYHVISHAVKVARRLFRSVHNKCDDYKD